MISLFKSKTETIPTDQVSLEQVVELIKNDPRLHKLTTKLKSIANSSSLNKDQRKDKIDSIKQNLPAVIFSGQFGKRVASELQQHSGYIIIDIDDVSTDAIDDTRQQIIDQLDPVLLFISPSQRGIKVLHKIEIDSEGDVKSQHVSFFNQLEATYRKELNITIDKSGKDLARLCFLIGDSDIYFNPESPAVSLSSVVNTSDIEANSTNSDTDYESDRHQKKIAITSVIEYLKKNDKSITVDYDNWSRVGYALKNEFGEEGRKYFIELSKLDDDYEPAKVNKQFDNGEVRAGDYKVTIGTILHLAKEQGFSNKHISDLSVKKFYQAKTAEEVLQTNGYKFRFNTLTQCIEIDKCGDGFSVLDEKTLNTIYFSELHRSLTINDTVSMLYATATDYDPVQVFIKSLPEIDPEIDYIKQLAETIKSTNDDLTYAALKVWLVGFIRGLLDDSFANELVPILIGGQGIGKTLWTERLKPSGFEKFHTSKNLDPKEKDHLKLLCTHFWIVMDELSTILTHKASTESFKAMMTAREHTIRLPYARTETRLLRKASIIGTSNEEQYLRDLTGNRRFISIKVIKMNGLHSIDMMKVYSQAYRLYKQLGNKAGVIDYELQNKFEEHNQEFEVTNPYIEYVQKYFCPAHTKGSLVEWMTTTEIIDYINSNENNQIILPSAASTLGKILKKIGYSEPDKRRINKINGRWYAVYKSSFVNENRNRFKKSRSGLYYLDEKGLSGIKDDIRNEKIEERLEILNRYPKNDYSNDPSISELLKRTISGEEGNMMVPPNSMPKEESDDRKSNNSENS